MNTVKNFLRVAILMPWVVLAVFAGNWLLTDSLTLIGTQLSLGGLSFALLAALPYGLMELAERIVPGGLIE